ncbi:hypothetical protein FSP39_016578, partial [Pinctada imbricata]
WDNLHTFIQTVGWDLIFDLNALQRNGKVWDPQNAISLIEYTKRKNYKVAGWELGNEPNAFHHLNSTLPNVTAADLAYDYGTLAEILYTHQPAIYNMLGPSTTQLNKKHTIRYYKGYDFSHCNTSKYYSLSY